MSEDDKTHLSDQGAAPSKPAPPLQITPGTVLKATYRIDAELGAGGMGTVYRATHLGLDKIMAVKVLAQRAISTPDSLARFEREAKVAGKVSHPAMTDVIDFGVEQGTPYIVMEYVSGAELADLIERQGPMPPRRAVAVMRQIVSLLRAAHALGIVHRDLKPSNIKIIQESPEDSQIFVKVLDFGIAKVVGDSAGQLTSEGMLVGTPAYMAPEQISGQPIDGRTDLYSAGLIFHEMLSGKRAYKGETIARILHAQINEPPPALGGDVPDIVRQTLQKFYEKRPADRFQDAAEADQALMACEDVLRPPSVKLAGGTVRPASAEPALVEGASGQEPDANTGGRTITYQPKQAEPVRDAEGKPPSNVSVAPSLVTEKPAAKGEPAPVSTAPASTARPAPHPASAPPRQSSGSSKVLAVLGVGVLLLVVGLAGGIWAWTSGRLAGIVPFAPSANKDTPSDPGRDKVGSTEPAEPRQKEPEPTAPEPTEVAKADTPTEPQPGEGEGTEPGETPGTDAAGDEPGDESGTQVAADAPEAAGQEAQEAPEPEEAQEPPPPPKESLAPGCYVAVVAFESSRRSDGKFGPWQPMSVDSRTSINCSSISGKKNTHAAQGLFDHWPDSPTEKLLHYNPQSFQPQKKGEPNTRRMVVKAYTRVSESAP